MFNSLKCAKVLEEVGVPRIQAEAHIQIMMEVIDTHLATKQDVTDVKGEIQSVKESLKNEIQALRTELHTFRSEFKQDIIQSEYRMTIKLGTIVSIAIGVAVTLTKLI